MVHRRASKICGTPLVCGISKLQQISDWTVCGQSRLWQAVYIFYQAVSGIPYARSQESAHMKKCWLPASLSHNNIPVFFPLSLSVFPLLSDYLQHCLFSLWDLTRFLSPFDPMCYVWIRALFWPYYVHVPVEGEFNCFLIKCDSGHVAVVGFGSVISPTVECVSQKLLCRMSDRRFHCYEVQTDLFPLKQMPDHTSGFAFPYTHMHLDYFTLQWADDRRRVSSACNILWYKTQRLCPNCSFPINKSLCCKTFCYQQNPLHSICGLNDGVKCQTLANRRRDFLPPRDFTALDKRRRASKLNSSIFQYLHIVFFNLSRSHILLL